MTEPGSKSGIWRPTASEKQKKVAGPCEVSALKLIAGGGAAVVSIYDGTGNSDAVESNLKWVMDASTTNNDSQVFENPLIFKKGVFAVCEQGINFNPILCIATKAYTV